MPLEDLLAKVKDEKRKEEIRLKREHKNALEDLDSQKREEMESLRVKFEKEMKEKKAKLLENKEREEDFRLKMERLDLKKGLLEKAKKAALKKLENISLKERKKIYLSKLKEKKKILNEAEEIAVPKGKKKKLESLLKETGIDKKPVEKELDFQEGFLAKGDRWTLAITLEEILQDKIKEDKKDSVTLLFGDL